MTGWINDTVKVPTKETKSLMMYKTMNYLAPEYLQSLFSQRHSAYNLRNSEGKLTLSKPSANYLQRSFSYSGPCYGTTCPKAYHIKKVCKAVVIY